MFFRKRIGKLTGKAQVGAIALVLGLGAVAATAVHAQSQQFNPATGAEPPLALMGVIQLPHVVGRLDHMDFDPNGRLFLSALGSNQVEVIDLSGERVVRTLPVPHPQGEAFVPGLNKIFVASDEGQLFIFDGANYQLMDTINFGDDADDLRYDAATKQVYVGYGDGADGAIGVVDAVTDKLVRSYHVGEHPESFQLETKGPEMFVNVPLLKEILAINRQTGKVVRWPMTLRDNYPMALDEADHRLFVIMHHPPRLAVFNTDNGHLITTLPAVANSDDLYYDDVLKRVYATGGQGFISVFQQETPNTYKLLADVPSGIGGRTSDFQGRIGMKEFDRFYVGVPATAAHEAEVLIYSVLK